MEHPPSSPKSTARAIIQHPGRAKDVDSLVLPSEPWMGEQVLDRPYMAGSAGTIEELDETSSIYVRLPTALLAFMDEIIFQHAHEWYKSRSDLIRHAVYELIWVYAQMLKAKQQGDPARWREVEHILAKQAELTRQTLLLRSRQGQENHLRAVEQTLARAIKLGNYREINRMLSSLENQAKAQDPSLPDTWAVEMQHLLANSDVVERAVNALVNEWQLSDSGKLQHAADEWHSWWENMRQHKTRRGKSAPAVESQGEDR